MKRKWLLSVVCSSFITDKFWQCWNIPMLAPGWERSSPRSGAQKILSCLLPASRTLSCSFYLLTCAPEWKPPIFQETWIWEGGPEDGQSEPFLQQPWRTSPALEGPSSPGQPHVVPGQARSPRESKRDGENPGLHPVQLTRSAGAPLCSHLRTTVLENFQLSGKHYTWVSSK